MTSEPSTGPIRTTLIDIANCIGCRACQVACKQWNEKDGEQTELDDQLGFQNPAALSAKTLANHKANVRAALRWLGCEKGLPTRGAPLDGDRM